MQVISSCDFADTNLNPLQLKQVIDTYKVQGEWICDKIYAR